MAERLRVPPGQDVTEKFPVLTYGATPKFDPKRWSFRVVGLVENPIELTYEQFMKLPTVKVTADFHCVTRWSRLDNLWEGVSIHEILRTAKPKPEAKYVMAYCDGGYATNLPVSALMADNVLLAYKHDGRNLEPDHGWPLRLVVPSRYAWKSAKWLRGLEFMTEDRPGFWEVNGYHNDADPWREERFSD